MEKCMCLLDGTSLYSVWVQIYWFYPKVKFDVVEGILIFSLLKLS